MIIIHKLVDLIEVIRIRVVALYAEVSFNRFGKELPLSAFVLAILSSIIRQCWIVVLTLWLEKVLILHQDLHSSVSKLVELQNFCYALPSTARGTWLYNNISVSQCQIFRAPLVF